MMYFIPTTRASARFLVDRIRTKLLMKTGVADSTIMKPQRAAIGTTIVAVIVMVIVIGMIGFATLDSQTVPPEMGNTTSVSTSVASSTSLASSSSTSSTGQSASYSTVSAASGLKLQVTLNSSSIPPQGEVAVQIELLNTQ